MSPADPVSVWRVALGAVLVAALALILRLALLDNAPFHDELYHYLAAQSWLRSGELAILDGAYERGAWFTILAAKAMDLFGGGLDAARIAALIPGIALAAGAYLFGRLTGGPVTGWVAGLLTAFWPQGIEEAQFLRFYSLQAFLFLCATAALWGATQVRALAPRVALGALSAFAFAAATLFQITTVIGLSGVLLWFCLVCVLPAILAMRARWAILGGLAACGLAGLGLAIALGWAGAALDLYRWTPAHAADTRDYVFFYHAMMLQTYPVLWCLFPVAVVCAASRHPRLTMLCGAVVAAAFIGQSFGGMKAQRYVSYALPFFFLIWGLAIEAYGRPALQALRDGAAKAVEALGASRKPAQILGALALAGAFAFALLTNAFFASSVAYGLGKFGDPQFNAGWADGRELIDAATADNPAPYVVATRELHTTHYLGGYDILFNAERLDEINGPDFAEDFRTGRPIIESQEALEKVIACHPRGVFVTSVPFWAASPQADIARRAFADAGAELERLETGRFLALIWTAPRGPGDAAAECPAPPVV